MSTALLTAETAQEIDHGTHGLSVDTGSNSTSAATGRSRMACEDVPCSEHGILCAFHGNEPGRCPWCHSAWTVILRYGSHSCESARVWRGAEAKWRLAKARQMRQRAAEAAQEIDHGTHCTHLDNDTTLTPADSGRAVKGSQGTRDLVEVECNGCPRTFGVMLETLANAECSRCHRAVSYVGRSRSGWNSKRVRR